MIGHLAERFEVPPGLLLSVAATHYNGGVKLNMGMLSQAQKGFEHGHRRSQGLAVEGRGDLAINVLLL
jgi:hypothetical protein